MSASTVESYVEASISAEPLEPIELLRKLDEWLSFSRYGADHPWRLAIAATLEDDKIGSASLPTAMYVDVEEFDEHVGALQTLDLLTDACATWVVRQEGRQALHNDCAILLTHINAQVGLARKELDKSIGYLVQLAEQTRQGSK